MLSFREIVRMAGSVEELPLLKRIEMGLHFMMCRHCAAYMRQLRMITHSVKSCLGDAHRADADRVSEIEKGVLHRRQGG